MCAFVWIQFRTRNTKLDICDLICMYLYAKSLTQNNYNEYCNCKSSSKKNVSYLDYRALKRMVINCE